MNVNGKEREDLDDAEMVHPRRHVEVNKSDRNAWGIMLKARYRTFLPN
jgi:hypothetical protein